MTITDEAFQITALAAGAGYLFGAIPFGLLLTRLWGLGDIRDIGSGNIGATNVLRTGNKAVALLTLLLDIAKGWMPVAAAGWLAPGSEAAMLGGAAGAVIGHVFPLWLRFRGGKGVATLFGAVAGLCAPAALAALGTWVGVALISRMSSVAALVSLAVAPFYVWWFYGGGGFLMPGIIGGLALLVIARHHENIARLLRGDEPRIRFRKK